jgi:hypothetical protein
MADNLPDDWITPGAAPAEAPDDWVTPPPTAHERYAAARKSLAAGEPTEPAGAAAPPPAPYPRPQPAAETLGQYGQVAKGLATGIPATLSGGFLGDIESTGRQLAQPFVKAPISQSTYFPTTTEGGYLMPVATSQEEAFGRGLSSLLMPGLKKIPGAIRDFRAPPPPSAANLAPFEMHPLAPVGWERPDSGARLLRPEVPHTLPDDAPTTVPKPPGEPPRRGSVGALGISGPLDEISPPTIQHLREVLAEDGLTPYSLEQRLDEMSPHQFLGELNPNMEARMGAVGSFPGASRTEIVNSLRGRSAEENLRIRRLLDDAFGPPQDLSQAQRVMTVEQKRAAAPLYQAFRELSIPPTQQMLDLMPRIQAAGALGQARRIAAIEGIPWLDTFDMMGTPEGMLRAPTAQSWDLIKRGLDAKIESSFGPLGQPTNYTRIYTQLKNELISAIDNHPEPGIGQMWRAARDTFAEPARIMSAQRFGRRLMSDTIDPNEVPFMTAGYSPAEMRGVVDGIRAEFENKMGRAGPQERRTINQVLSPNAQQKIRWVIGDEPADQLFNGFEYERQMHDAPTRIVGGSPTAARTVAQQAYSPQSTIMSAENIGHLLHFAHHPLLGVTRAVVSKSMQAREAAAVRLREEVSRLMTLQGPERDAVLRWLIENPNTPPRATGGRIKPIPDNLAVRASHQAWMRVKKRAAGGRIGYAEGGTPDDFTTATPTPEPVTQELQHTPEGYPYFQKLGEGDETAPVEQVGYKPKPGVQVPSAAARTINPMQPTFTDPGGYAVRPSVVDPGRAAPASGDTVKDLMKRGQTIRPPADPTPEELAAARADTRVGGQHVADRLDTIVPPSERVAGGSYAPGAPGGGKWSDLPKSVLDQPGTGFRVTDEQLRRMWGEAVAESSVAAKNAVASTGARPTYTAKDWDAAMKLPIRDHLWYELSGEKLADNLPQLTGPEFMKEMDLIGATSARAKPQVNAERSLAALSQHMRGVPVDVDLPIPSTVRLALGRESAQTSALVGNKTGHFSDTLALTGGVPTRFPISVNDVWVGKMFGINDDVMSANQSLHEPMAKYFNKLRDYYNTEHANDQPFVYQSWNFQAPSWVHSRVLEGAASGDAYHQVWGNIIDKLNAAGVKGINGDQITREALMDPKFADALRLTTGPWRAAPKATVEFGTTQTDVGRTAHDLYQRAIDTGDQVSQREYLNGLVASMYKSGRGAGHAWETLKKAITGDLTHRSNITRIASPVKEEPLDIGGSFEGAVSPNIRVPLSNMTDAQINYYNAVVGAKLKQDAMAASQVLPVEHGSEPKEGYVRGHSVFVPSTEQIAPTDIRAFARELGAQGHDFSYSRYPNGYQFDVLPNFGETVKGADRDVVENAYAKSLLAKYGNPEVLAHDFKSVYTPSADYAAARAGLVREIENDFVKQAGTGKDAIPEDRARQAIREASLPVDVAGAGKRAWTAYRARLDHLTNAEAGFEGLANDVSEAHSTFIGRASARFARAQKPEPERAAGGRVNKRSWRDLQHGIVVQGLPIAIEHAKGSIRHGMHHGKPWAVKMPADYGYFEHTNGADGDEVDVYVGPHKMSPKVYVINQQDPENGHFDEHKVMLGFASKEQAAATYKRGFSDGRGHERLGSITEMTIDELKRKLKRPGSFSKSTKRMAA